MNVLNCQWKSDRPSLRLTHHEDSSEKLTLFRAAIQLSKVQVRCASQQLSACTASSPAALCRRRTLHPDLESRPINNLHAKRCIMLTYCTLHGICPSDLSPKQRQTSGCYLNHPCGRRDSQDVEFQQIVLGYRTSPKNAMLPLSKL